MKHPMLLVSTEPSERLGLKNVFRHILGWKCSNPANVGDQCSRLPGTGSHVIALAILLFCTGIWNKRRLAFPNLFDTRLKSSLQPKACFNLNVFNDNGQQSTNGDDDGNNSGHTTDDDSDDDHNDMDDSPKGPGTRHDPEMSGESTSESEVEDNEPRPSCSNMSTGQTFSTSIFLENLAELNIKEEVVEQEDRSFIEARDPTTETIGIEKDFNHRPQLTYMRNNMVSQFFDNPSGRACWLSSSIAILAYGLKMLHPTKVVTGPLPKPRDGLLSSIGIWAYLDKPHIISSNMVMELFQDEYLNSPRSIFDVYLDPETFFNK